MLARRSRRSLLDCELKRGTAHGLNVLTLDGDGPVGELPGRRFAGLLRHHSDDLPVAELAGLGHAEELEAIERLLFAAEVGLHHLGRLGLRLARLLADRRLAAIECVHQLVGSPLGLLSLSMHPRQSVAKRVRAFHATDLLGRVLCGFREAEHLAQLLVKGGEIRHWSSVDRVTEHYPVHRWLTPLRVAPFEW